MKTEKDLTSVELIDWIKNVGRELNSMDSSNRNLPMMINKGKAIGLLAHTAIKIEALQITKHKMGITSNEIGNGVVKILGIDKKKDLESKVDSLQKELNELKKKG